MEAKEVTLLMETAKYFICLADAVMKSNIRISQEAVNVLNDYFVKQLVFMNYLQSLYYSFGANYNNATNFPHGSTNDCPQQMFKPASTPTQTVLSNPPIPSSKTIVSSIKGSKGVIDTSPKHEPALQVINVSKSITGFFTSYINSVLSRTIRSFDVYCLLCDKLFEKDREWAQHVFNVNHRDIVKLLVSRGKRMQMYECPSCVVSIYGDIDDSQSLIEYHNYFIHPPKVKTSDKGLSGSLNMVHSVSSESLRSKDSSNTPLHPSRGINITSNSASSSSVPNQMNKVSKLFTKNLDKYYFIGMNSIVKCVFCQPCMVWCHGDKDWNSHSNGKYHKKTNMDIINQNKDTFFSCNGCGLSIFGLSSSVVKLVEYHNEKIHPFLGKKSSTSSVEAPLPKSQGSNIKSLNDRKSSTSSVEASLPKSQGSNIKSLNERKSSTSSVEAPLPKSQGSNIKSIIKASYFDSVLKYLNKTKMTFYCALCDKYLDQERLKFHVTGIQHKNCIKSTSESKSLKMFRCIICPELTVFGEEHFVLQLFEQHFYNHKQTYLEQNKEFTYNDIKKEIDWNGMPGFKLTSVKDTSKVNSKNISQSNVNESKVGHQPNSMNTATPTSLDIQKKQNDKQLSKCNVTSNAASVSYKGSYSASSESLKDYKDNKGTSYSNTGSKKGSPDKSGQLVKSDPVDKNITCLPDTSSGDAGNDDSITNLFSGYIDALSVKLFSDIGVYCHPCDMVLNKGDATTQHLSSGKHISVLKLPENLNASFKHCNVCRLSIFGGYKVLTKLFNYHLIRNHNIDDDISTESSEDKTVNMESQNPLNPNSTSSDNHTKMESNSHLIRSEQSPYSEFENLLAGMAEEFSGGIEADGGYCTICSTGFLMDAFGWEFHMMEHRNNPSDISQGTLQTCQKCSLKIFGTDHNTFFNLPTHKKLH